MISSKLILDIFELAFDSIADKELLLKQIVFLTEGETEHTGVGLFINFIKDENIDDYQAGLFDVSMQKHVILNGLELTNVNEGILADAIVHLENGIIYGVEIFNKIGNEYPKDEPKSYEISQLWLEEPLRKMIKR